MRILRIQDAEGRGPWKPGFSDLWVRNDPDNELVPFWEDCGTAILICPGEFYGSGCRTVEQLKRWFNPTEYAILLSFGYQAVKMRVDRIVGESSIQCVFAREIPLYQNVEPFDLYGEEP